MYYNTKNICLHIIYNKIAQFYFSNKTFDTI